MRKAILLLAVTALPTVAPAATAGMMPRHVPEQGELLLGLALIGATLLLRRLARARS